MKKYIVILYLCSSIACHAALIFKKTGGNTYQATTENSTDDAVKISSTALTLPNKDKPPQTKLFSFIAPSSILGGARFLAGSIQDDDTKNKIGNALFDDTNYQKYGFSEQEQQNLRAGNVEVNFKPIEKFYEDDIKSYDANQGKEIGIRLLNSADRLRRDNFIQRSTGKNSPLQKFLHDKTASIGDDNELVYSIRCGDGKAIFQTNEQLTGLQTEITEEAYESIAKTLFSYYDKPPTDKD